MSAREKQETLLTAIAGKRRVKTKLTVDVTKHLPETRTGGVHEESLAFAVVKAHSVGNDAVVLEVVAVHVEDVAHAAVGINVPDDLVIVAGLEARKVGED